MRSCAGCVQGQVSEVRPAGIERALDSCRRRRRRRLRPGEPDPIADLHPLLAHLDRAGQLLQGPQLAVLGAQQLVGRLAKQQAQDPQRARLSRRHGLAGLWPRPHRRWSSGVRARTWGSAVGLREAAAGLSIVRVRVSNSVGTRRLAAEGSQAQLCPMHSPNMTRRWPVSGLRIWIRSPPRIAELQCAARRTGALLPGRRVLQLAGGALAADPSAGIDTAT